MLQIGADIKSDQIERQVVKLRSKRTVHKSTDELLAVPRYRDLLQDQDDEDSTERGPVLVSTAGGWRAVMAKWVDDARAAEIDAAENESESEDEDIPARTPRATAAPKWKRKTLAQLFGGSTKKHAERLSQKEIEAEARLMVALAEAERQADEDEDAQPDDGAVEIPSDEEYVA
ncbi:hypothetical protein FB451DRAFT_1273818 [Mycena latifolia]|nr:hypothetical protein FB451DRAFT_1325216 [Mycena latifolia]KAJ7440615.1 hypothetical protein FB451DRAFT_1300024 [Mycena latifolia]KAJ7458160.1 hypothetical protein FB451DRAFT_1273818 [Mycena latifolia]